MWKSFFSTLLGGQKPTILELPPEEKPDYSGLIAAIIAILTVLALFYFLTKKT